MIYIVGMGPGAEEQMTGQAIRALEESDVIVGYPVYVELLGERFRGKKFLTTPMRQEVERCRMCYEEALQGKTVSLICSGDAGIYGMASLMYEIGREYPDITLRIVPGITAAISGAAVLGAPLNHDFCVVSLSDLLTPWEKIEKRYPNAYLVLLYWDSEMFGRSTRSRKEMEKDQAGKDYRALCQDVLYLHPERYTIPPDTKRRLSSFKCYFVKSWGFATETEYRILYECLIRGDPKMRTLRALWVKTFGKSNEMMRKEVKPFEK